ncbi:MAG: hypothetical protein ACLFRX_09470, partial [Gemmatimonadota bacterium]
DVPFARDRLEAAFDQADGVLSTITEPIDRDLLARSARKAAIIANFGVGVDNIDLEAAKQNGVIVTNTPDVLTDATADLAIALTLAATRRMYETEKALRELEIKNQRRLHKRTRPQALHGTTRKMRSPLGDLYVTVNEDEDGHPFEVFATLGKAGGAAMAHAEAIGRLISLALRSGIPMDDVVNQLRGISCDRAVGIGPNKVLSMPDAIGQVLQLHMQEKEGIQEELGLGGAAPRSAPAAIRTDTPDTGRADVGRGPDAEQRSLDYYDPGDAFIGTCPECASDLMFAEGCAKCPSCGYSECG